MSDGSPTRTTRGGTADALPWSALQPYFLGLRPSTYLLALPEHGLVYVKNPKAACSTILVWLDRLHTGDSDMVFTNVHKQHRLPSIGEIGRPVVRRMLSGAAYRFAFVRNPLRRLESVYWDKLVHARKSPIYRRRIRAELALPPDREGPISFEQFLTAVEQQDPVAGMNPHWRPQHVNLLHPVLSYDCIGRVESFAADLERIREEAGLPHVPIDVRNASRQASTDSVYDGRPDLLRRVEQIYAKDLELYGY